MSNRRKSRPADGVARRDSQATKKPPLAPGQQPVTVTEVTEMIAHSWWSGPLPKPEDLAKYEQVSRGSAERIIRMAEEQGLHVRALEVEQSSHRRSIEFRIVDGIERRSNIGQWLAASIALTAIAAGGYIAGPAGSPAAGGTVVAAVFAGGALVWFLGGKPPRSNNGDEV